MNMLPLLMCRCLKDQMSDHASGGIVAVSTGGTTVPSIPHAVFTHVHACSQPTNTTTSSTAICAC